MNKEWWDLRELVLAAAEGKESPRVSEYPASPIVASVLIYLQDRTQESLLNDAARTLATRKTRVDSAMAGQHPGLVLDKP
jgi:hypothetical protein